MITVFTNPATQTVYTPVPYHNYHEGYFMTTPNQKNQISFLTYRHVCQRYNIGSSTLYRWIADEKFPEGKRENTK